MPSTHAADFLTLHTRPETFVLPNVWDAGSVEATIHGVIAAGAVGANLEDADPANRGSLFSLEQAVERVEAARAAADAEGAAFVLNARTDPYLVGAADPFGEAVERAARYVGAGADCVFVP